MDDTSGEKADPTVASTSEFAEQEESAGLDDETPSMRSETSSKGLLNRRNCLKAGAAMLAAGSSAFVGGAAAATERYGIQFSTVVDAVDDLGLDPNGNDPIDSTLEDALASGDTLVEFPAGTYYFDGQLDFGSPDNWGIRGLGSSPSDVRFVTTPGEGRYLTKTNGGSGQLVENVTFDYSAEDDGGLGIVLRGEDKIRVQDVEFVGFNPVHADGSKINVVPMALDPNGRAVIDGLVRTGPTDIVSHGHLDGNSNDSCIWLGDRHEGELVIRNSHIENTGTNAVYASRTSGTVHYENCLFRNNNQTSIRIGGGDGNQNTIQNCTFVVDTENADPDNGGEFINPHGVVCETNETTPGPIRIEDCEFMYKSGPDRGRLLFADGNAGPIEIVNSRFRSENSEVEPIFARGEPRWWKAAPDQSIDIRKSQFSGSGEVTVNDRPATMQSGCISSPVSGVDVDESVSRDSCTIPDTDAPAESTEEEETESDTTTTTPTNELTVTGTGTKTNYEFAVGGQLEATDDVEAWDEVSESSVNGWITSEGVADTYQFSGPLQRIEFLEGEAKVSVNGQQIDPATLSTSGEFPSTLQIPGNGSTKNYRVSVTGEIADHPALGTSLSEYDTVSDGTLEGWATDEMDAIQFSGSVESIELLEGDGSMYLNGKQIDPATYDPATEQTDEETDEQTDEETDEQTDESTDDATKLPNTITIDGDGAGATTYSFSVSGDVVRSDKLSSGTGSTTIDSLTDSTSDGTVNGYISQGVDGYRYSGEITSLSINGDASVSISDNDG
ncbi:right-handed parallel beta-helix repeat-containing protein [Halobellus sp. Atlit-38R]|uniref:right-handed parallel beta-helix repeat-containing protein n=1 Tax=Halobellus sp. Atlit-38R TaxID=2282131 RepID=UPI0011C40C94|nr:right-handed parallel beta-helix repeat-containing protein [Halobellus sp. Atlit-38R]